MDHRPDDNRRSAIRRRVKLPFEFVRIDTAAGVETLCDALGVPRAVTLGSRLADLEDAFERALAALTDAGAREAVRVLDRRIVALEEVLLADLPVPAPAELELSADGIGFASTEEMDADGWIAVHLVLPVNYHLVAAARVSRCAPPERRGGTYRVGAEFHRLDDAPARRLTRFTIGRDLPGDD